ncbi:response regulator [Zavarzinella formosa]|uniref:response regulator n=1 Tax=Zavarzinella formosa TaxID=360055 RepID=UPI0002F4A75B|nr:response regulator [Zavarzinella formosa]
MPQTIPVKILIVDDLPEKRLVYQSVLEELGPEIVTAPSGHEALKQILKSDFAVILLDVNMPEMDGFETARMIRARRRSAHTPIIFLTAFADEVKTAEGYATGAVDYLSTPVIPDILRAKVRVFIDLFRMRQHLASQAEEEVRRIAAEDSARRSAFLSDSSRALSNSLDYEATLKALVRLPLKRLADVCLVTMTEDTLLIGRTDFAWGDASTGSLRDVSPFEDWLANVLRRVLETGQHQVLSPLPTPAMLFRKPGAGTPEQLEEHPSAVPAVTAVIVLPLVARGKTLGMYTLARDETGRGWSRDDISLARELADRAGIAMDNALLMRNIQENDRRKSEFLATLAHELRNPLAPIRNALQVIGMAGDDRQVVEQSRFMMERQLNQMVRLVDDLLDVSRINRNKLELRKELVGMAAVIDSAIETSLPLIKAGAHQLQVSMPPETLWVEADSTRLAQVVANLLNNAAKYTERGGNIWLTAERTGGEVAVRVRDDGIGIPAGDMPRIFDLFSQVDRHHKRAQGGLGIGLSLVHRLVEMHGGSVEARSQGPGLGSEFIIRIPLAANEKSQPEQTVAQADEVTATERRRILVVDDNVDSAQSLGMMLELLGSEVRTAHDGLEAIETASKFRPDVVLLDIGMPKLNGYEAARRIREQPWGRTIILIAQTGWGQEEDRRKSREAGFDHHLVKPVDPVSLRSLLGESK